MVSHLRRRRARHALSLLVGLGVPFLTLGGHSACSREADIVDEPDRALLPTATATQDAEIPLLDAGLDTDAYAVCADRPFGPCKGPNDFVCGFVDWMRKVARDCQRQTGCITNGWLTVKMDDGGCVTDVGMDQPNDAIVECLLAAFGGVRCPCKAGQSTYYFGVGNTGNCPDASGPSG